MSIDKSDPERVDRIARILTDEIPNATVTHHDSGDFGGVKFRIDARGGVGTFVVSWERLQEDQDETEELVRLAIPKLGPGKSWLLTAAEGLVPLVPESN